MHPLLRNAIVVSLAMPWAPAMALNATVTESGELHSQPYFTAPRIAPVHRLSTVEVLEQRRDWVRIEIGGNRSGWVPERSLDLSTQAVEFVGAPADGEALTVEALEDAIG